MELQQAKTGFITKQNYLTRSFLWAGIAFLAVFFIGFGLKTGLVNQNVNTEAFSTAGWVLSIISMVTTIVWSFTFMKASKMFIFIAYGTYVVTQGFGFTMLFLFYNFSDLVYIFAIAGGLFLLMAVCGMVFNMSSVGKFLLVGMIAVSIMSMVMMILYWTGIYSDTFVFIMTILTGFLFLGYTAFDVWMIKKAGEYSSMSGMVDKEMEFRFIAFFSFRLLSDLIGLIWMVARIVLRNR